MKYQLSQEVQELFEEAKKEPYRSINAIRGTDIGYFRDLLSAVDQFIILETQIDGGILSPLVFLDKHAGKRKKENQRRS